MILLTGGCSFTETITGTSETWPIHVHRHTGMPLVSTGMGSEGNGMIARRVIHAVHEQLKTTPAEDILVGVMWSGPSRHEQYNSTKVNFGKNINGWVENPTSFVQDDQGGWIIYNSYWDIKPATIYYRYTYDEIFSQIQTLEHIIRVQNYLKLHNIKYFMSTYTDEVLRVKDNPNLTHLYEQVDFEQFLPVTSEFEWCKNNTPGPFAPDGKHPTTAQHKQFSEQVILPFIIKKFNIKIIETKAQRKIRKQKTKTTD